MDIRFHDLRHTSVRLALEQGVPLHTVSRIIGHSDPAITLRRYAHVLEDMKEDTARAMTSFSEARVSRYRLPILVERRS